MRSLSSFPEHSQKFEALGLTEQQTVDVCSNALLMLIKRKYGDLHSEEQVMRLLRVAREAIHALGYELQVGSK